MNAAQWAGNYSAAGVTGIRMHLRNLGDTDQSIRLYLEDPIPGPPLNEAVTNSVLLPAGSGWTSVLFPVTAGDLTVLQGNAATLLSNTTVLRVFHNPAADFPGLQTAAAPGIDNVQAVPEPSTVASVLAGLGLLAVALRRRSRAPARAD